MIHCTVNSANDFVFQRITVYYILNLNLHETLNIFSHYKLWKKFSTSENSFMKLKVTDQNDKLNKINNLKFLCNNIILFTSQMLLELKYLY